ncbi:MAG: DinB family protein [Cyclobacteriaceae bacterium]
MERGEIEVRKHLVSLLSSENAHVSIQKAITGIHFEQLGETRENQPYSLWQQIEHVRLAQKDIVDYTLDDNYEQMQWPEDYWPEENAPVDQQAYQQSLYNFAEDLNRMIEHIKNPQNNLYENFSYGEGHNLLREALLLADHNAYHSGQIILMRKMLNDW